MKIVSRKEAKAAGLAEYFTGRPCNLGGIAARNVASKKCQCDFHKKAMSDRARKNYLSNRAERLEKAKVYKNENLEAVKARQRAHYQANKSKIKSRSAEWKEKNRERRKEIARNWASSNMQTVTVNTRKRQARKLNATPLWFGELDELVMAEAYDLAKRREKITGFKWEVDHTIPLAGKNVCGLHVGSNIQVIPMTMNRQKSNRHHVA